MKDQVRIKVAVKAWFNTIHEDEIFIDRPEWDAMTEKEQRYFLKDNAHELRDNYISCSAWVVEEGEV